MNKKKEETTSMEMQIKKDRNCKIFGDFSLCSIVECYKCERSDYKIVAKDGTIIKDFEKDSEFGQKPERYVVQFFDDVDSNNIEEYLSNSKSDYRIVSQDGIILRKSSNDKSDTLDDSNIFQLFYEEFIKKEEPKRKRSHIYNDYEL